MDYAFSLVWTNSASNSASNARPLHHPQRNPLCRIRGCNPQNRHGKGPWLSVSRQCFMVALLSCHCMRVFHTVYNLGTTKHCKLSELRSIDGLPELLLRRGSRRAAGQGQPAQMGNSAWSWLRRKVKMLTFFFHFFELTLEQYLMLLVIVIYLRFQNSSSLFPPFLLQGNE